jgi:hypothetical protein
VHLGPSRHGQRQEGGGSGLPKFLAERRTERGERNHAGCACNALKRFGEGSGPEPGPLRSLNQRIHDTAHSTGGSGKRHPGEAFGSLVGPLRGAEPGERAWTPDPYSRPNEGGGDPCQSDLGPQGIPGELTTGLHEGGGDPCQSDLAPRTLPGIARSGAGMGHPASL